MSGSNPKFNMARGAATMTAAPPFEFENVILRVFPLRADIHALRLFCDRFLNVAPEFALFEPAAPYVMVETINYGRMAPEASNFGWVSQNEVAFAVLLNWYRIENGKPVFHDSASVCPFIFVDEETSVRGGREVFGWPKSLSWLTPGIDAWARDPRSPRTLFTLSAMVFPELFAGRRQEARVLFEIEQGPSPSAAEFPVNPFNELNPMVSLPRTVLSSMKMAGEMIESLMRMPIQGFPLPGFPVPGLKSQGGQSGVAGAGFRTAPPWDMLRNAFGGMNPFAQLPAFNTVNLKQFRDSSAPEEVCYQALVNARMTAKSVRRGGLLGQQAMALGDPSGGFSLKIHRSPAWPIIESLGLEVASESTVGGRQVATLKPVLPNWMETDFHYGTGEVICWRTRHTDWAKAPGTAKEPPVGCPPPTSEDQKRPCGKPHRYNTAQGGSLDQVRGPFYFPDVTMRVLPLLADEGKLQEFCDGYLNHRKTVLEKHGGEHPAWRLRAVGGDGEGSEGLPSSMFRAWGRYVYMIVTNFEEVTSDLNVGWWARRQVSFAIPVKWYRLEREEGKDPYWRLVSSALVSPFVYADSSVATTTGREMQGRPVARADIESPPTGWLGESGPNCAEEVLKLSADVYPALNVGQKIERRTLLEITGRDVLPRWDEEGWRTLATGAANWGETIAAELERKTREGTRTVEAPLLRFKGLALEILSGRRPVNHISLKQFRDAEDPHSACYQAITLSPETLERVHDLREIEDRLHVAVHRYPSQPIVEKLGLKVKWTDASGETVIDYLQPIRPFWLRANVRVDLGTDVFRRAGSPTWVPADPQWLPHPLFFERVLPKPYGLWEARWVEENDDNKRRLQDLGNQQMTRELEEAEKTRRRERRSELETEMKLFEEYSFLLAGADTEEERRERLESVRGELEELDRERAVEEIGKREAVAAAESVERHGMTPQLALESILSNEWLHFGRPRWEREREAAGAGFDQRITELADAAELRELGRARHDVPPPKRDFLIRRDTVGHPGIQAIFERDHALAQLDNDYWYWMDEGDRKDARIRRWGIRERLWKRLEESWRKELARLEADVAQLESRAEPFPVELRELRTALGEAREELERRVKAARKSREFQIEYAYIERLIGKVQSETAKLQGKCEEHELSALKRAFDGMPELPLKTAEIKHLSGSKVGARRIETLAGSGIRTVQDLALREPEALVELLGVGEKAAARMLREARSIIARESGKEEG